MPQPFLERLDSTAAQLRAVAQRATASWTVAAALASAALLATVDWLGRYNDPGLRWVFTGTFLAAVIATAVGAYRRHRPNDASRLGVAHRLQELRPELGSRLASAVEFADSEAADSSAGSAQLRRAVVLEVANDSESLPFKDAVNTQPLKRSLRWLLGAACLVGALAAANGPALGTGLYRLTMPWAHAPWPRLVALRLVEGPTILARGASFEAIAVNDSGPVPADMRIEYRQSARLESAPAMIVAEQAVASRDRVQQPFAYRFIGGDDNTMPWTELEVIDPPVAEGLSLEIVPPAYSGLAQSKSLGPLKVLAGSELQVHGTSDKPLVSASVLLPEDKEIPLKLDQQHQHFSLGNDPWEAIPSQQGASSAAYRIRLQSESGVDGFSGPHRYEVLVDTPPKVHWRATGDDDVVTAQAIIAVAGEATDNLALQRVELEWSVPSMTPDAEPTLERIAIDQRGETPPTRRTLSEGDNSTIDYDWDLTPLTLKEGTELSITLVATDYLPQEGRTASARRLMVVSDEEYRSRLAERQSRLLGQVQQALAAQRDAAGAASELAADSRDSAGVDRSELDRLTSIEFQQREIASQVDASGSGATATAEQLLDDLRRSRIEASDLDEQLSSALQAMRQLSQGSLSSARSNLAATRRAAQRAIDPKQSDPSANKEFEEGLQQAISEQADSVDQLEQVADLLTSWADFQRFAGEAAALEELQRKLADETTRQAAEAASKLFPDPTQAERDKLVIGQAEAARRFGKLRSAMQKLLASQPEGAKQTNSQQSVGDALAEGDDADIAGKLRNAARDMARSRLGSASQAQREAADGLHSMLEALRRQTTSDPQELARRLGEEKQKLADLQRKVEDLKQRPDTRQTKAAQQRTAERAARLGRRLDRLTAPQAAASTQQGAQQAGSQPQGDQQQNDQSPSGKRQQQLAKAQESFQQAQKQIDQRMQELDNERTERLLDQLAQRIGGYIERQKTLLQNTIDLDRVTDARQAEQEAIDLAADEFDLSDELSRYAQELRKRAVFEMALGGAARLTSDAAERLDEARTDKVTQRMESTALARLRHIDEVLQQKPPEPQEDQPQGGGGGGGAGQQGQSPPPSPIDVAELRMLRLMQLEVLDETDAYEADTAAARRSGKSLPSNMEKTGKTLATRQKRLAELALELAERDNDPELEGPGE